MPKNIYISLIAVSVSLLFSLLIVPRMTKSMNIIYDPDRYGQLGLNVAEGRGMTYRISSFPATDRGPFYPGFLAILFMISGGYSLTLVQIVQALLHGGTTLLVYFTARRLYPERYALAAQIVCGLYPVLIWFTARIWVETIMTFLIALLAYGLVVFLEKPAVEKSILLGIAIAALALVKSVMLLFPFVLLIYFIRIWRWNGLYRGLVIIFVAAALISPWTVRNYLITGKIIPIHTSLGINLIEGDVIGQFLTDSPLEEYPLWQKGALVAASIRRGWENPETSYVAENVLTAISLRHSMEHPLFFIKRCALNLLTLFYLGDSPLKSVVLFLFLVPLVVMAFIGWRKGRGDNRLRMMGWLLVYYIIVHALIYGKGRFAAPLVPVMILLSIGILNPGEKNMKNCKEVLHERANTRA